MKIKISSFSLILVLSISYLIFRLLFIFPISSDENIYFNMAKAVNEGLLPYKDFFYAHPPFQLFLFQPVLIFFGANFTAIKIFITIVSVFTAILTYFIAKEIFGDFAAFFSFLFFLVFPGFLIFSNQAMGMFEALLFFLLGFYFSLKRKFTHSAIFLSIAIFTRYMTILLLPFLFYYLLQSDRKNLANLAKKLILTTSIIAVALVIIFGKDFLADTLVYHTQANISIKAGLAQWIDQYLSLGFFTIFLSIAALAFAFIRGDKKILAFAIYPLIYDFLILLSFKAVIYHYFILSLPFLFIAVGAAFAKAKDTLIRLSIVIIFVFSIITNLHSVGLYFDKESNVVFPALLSYVKSNLSVDDVIFGEPRAANYISFVTGVKIANNYFDSDLKFINFAGKDEVFNKVKVAKPKIIIIDNSFNYIQDFGEDYKEIIKWVVPNYYILSLYKLT